MAVTLHNGSSVISHDTQLLKCGNKLCTGVLRDAELLHCSSGPEWFSDYETSGAVPYFERSR